MVVTPLVQKGVDVKLPAALNTTSMPDSPDVVLAVKKDGTLYVNEDKVTMENLQNALEEAFLTVSEKKLYIKADQDLEYGKIVDLIDVMREAGIEIVGIITDKKTEKAHLIGRFGTRKPFPGKEAERLPSPFFYPPLGRFPRRPRSQVSPA